VNAEFDNTAGGGDGHLRGPSELAAHAVLDRLRAGEIEITGPRGDVRRFAGPEPGPSAQVTVRDLRAARRVITRGGLGLAEGYMAGDWDTPDLDAVLDLGLTNIRREVVRARGPAVAAASAATRLVHRLRDNTPGGSKRNVAYHYDLGNDFYELWLDDTMTYSGATFDSEAESLECAQQRKWDRLLELIQPSCRDHVLEIGCGWGGFAIHAAKEAGCRVTGITLSEEQAALAQDRVAREGLEGKVDIRLQDYRDVPGTYSAIASIEMFEAVGERWWPVFFGRMRDLLERGGAAAVQTITIANERFEHYRAHPDFIQRYVFPGGMLPSAERFEATARSAGLGVGEPRFFGADYAQTLKRWAERFETVLPSVREMGFDERFIRMWRYYLAYCRAGFLAGSVDVMQVRLERADSRFGT
jgi:cyclopropane-fatty-acyl-phospholipid synthase